MVKNFDHIFESRVLLHKKNDVMERKKNSVNIFNSHSQIYTQTLKFYIKNIKSLKK